jgi:hypothetical protein
MPQEVIEKAKDCLLDQIGVELIGSTLDWNKIAYRYVVEMAEGRKAPSSTTVPRRRLWTLRLSMQRSVKDASSTMWVSVPAAT